MNVFAVEASGSEMAMCALRFPTEDAACALFRSGETRQISRALMENLDATLKRVPWKIGDVEALCVGTGPGSWTSLRIILSMMKTLSQTRAIPLAGIATFEAAAHAVMRQQCTDFPSRYALLTLAPSRANEQYARLFFVENRALETLFFESVGTPQEIAERALASTRERGGDDAILVIFNLDFALQNATCEIGEIATRGIEVRAAKVEVEEVVVQIARLGAQKIQSGKADEVLSLLPIYVAPSAAERLREKHLAVSAASAEPLT